MMTSCFRLSMHFLYLLCAVNGSPIDDPNNTPRHTTEHFLMDKLRNAYKYIFVPETVKTTLEDDYMYPTLEALNRVKSIMEHQHILNQTWAESLDKMTLDFDDAETERSNVTKSFRVTEDPLLKRCLNPGEASRQKAEVEKLNENRKHAEEQAYSRRQYEMSFTRAEWSEEYIDPDEGIFQKVRRKIPFLKNILPNINMEDKIMNGLSNTFQKTFMKSAQSLLGERDVKVSETFKEDLSRKANEVHKDVKNVLGHVKEKVVEGMSKVAGALGRKIGKFLGNYLEPNGNSGNN